MINETKCVGICKYTFLIFQKGYKRKNCVRVCKVCKYTFLIFKKWDKLQNLSGFVNILLLMIEKRHKRKNCARFF